MPGEAPGEYSLKNQKIMFTSIFSVMQDGQSLSLHLIRRGDKLVVSFQPLASNGADAPGSKLTPLVATAIPGELDAGFITAIRTPLEERFGLVANLEEFQKSTQKAQPKATTNGTGTVSVEPATNTTAKKSKKEEQMEAAEKLAKAGNLPGAYGIYKKLYEQDKTDTKVGNRMHELWAQMSQKPLFPVETVQAVAEVPEAQPAVAEPPKIQPVIAPAVQEPDTTVAEEEAEPEDMFARIISGGRIQEPVAPVPVQEVPAAVDVPPGFDAAQYQKFLQYQEFLKSQGAAQPA
jgi:PRTRC genetic system protein E